ncbi:LuxR C-terminal-related transcriptional regulator [Promicromonospora sp. NPDC059942]|uniref:helix-turn-helix transcriptional regulator n=1 Tax=Promicromonospora sp. NPDC059942 TaxID=3347009 RepID=UPI0036488628
MAPQSEFSGIGPGGSGVYGRDSELRLIGSFAFDLDPTMLVVAGLSGAGKTCTVMAALERAGLGASTVRIAYSASQGPYVETTFGGQVLELPGLVADTSQHNELDPDQLLEALGAVTTSSGPRVLFVDDVDVLTSDRAAWLGRLTDTAYDDGWRVIVAARHVPAQPKLDEMDVLALGPLDPAPLRQLLQQELHQLIAEDVVAQLRWWSGGVPQVALELANQLNPEQLRGNKVWAGPETVGLVARRAYRPILDSLNSAQARNLARTVLHPNVADLVGRAHDRHLRAVPHGVAKRHADELAEQHPLLALLCRSQTGAKRAASVAEGLGPADMVAAALDGLHLEDLAGVTAAEITPRITAGVVAVALLTGTTLAAGRTGERLLRHMSPEWTDHLWWRSPPSDPAARAAGARVAAALIVLEGSGQLLDPAGFRSDLDRLDQVPEPHWVGVCIRVRSRLLLGDVAQARRLLDVLTCRGIEPTAAEIVARDLAEASIEIAEGRPGNARAHLAHAAQLRPGIHSWLPVRGHEALVSAMLDGQTPVGCSLPSPSPWSERAMGEYALDLGTACLAVGQTEQASVLLTGGLERCAWPYRGRSQSRADLVEAHIVTDGRLRSRARRLVRPPLAAEEQVHVNAAASSMRTSILLATDKRTTGLDDWLPVGRARLTPWLRLRSLIAYGHRHLKHGDDWSLQQAAREARTLADLAGVPGWSGAIDAALNSDGPDREELERLSEGERALVRLVAHGATNAQIAGAVYLSQRSVANRFSQIYTRLRVRDRRELLELIQVELPDWIEESD